MAEKRPEYTVTGKYVTARTMTTDGWRVVGLMEGARVPPDVDDDWIDHHLRKNLIAEVGKEPVAPADLDADEAAKYADALVLAGEADLEKAKERLATAKDQQKGAHERRDKAEADRAERDKAQPAPGSRIDQERAEASRSRGEVPAAKAGAQGSPPAGPGKTGNSKQ